MSRKVTIKVSEDVHRRLKSLGTLGDTFDTVIGNALSNPPHPLSPPSGKGDVKHDCMKDKRVVAERERLESVIEGLRGNVDPDLMLKDDSELRERLRVFIKARMKGERDDRVMTVLTQVLDLLKEE